MPLYEYRCKKCQRTFSLLVGMTAKPPPRACPHCGARQLSKLISRIAPIVRGDNFDSGDDFDEDDDLANYDDLED